MHFYGPTLTASAGLSGGWLGAGWGSVTDAGNSRVLITGLRTWRDPWFATSNATYLGIEYEHVAFVGFSLGIYRHVSRDPARAWFVSIAALVGG